MSNTIIKLEDISKQYRLGTVGTQSLKGDLQRWWYNLRGKEDPTLKIGSSNQLDTHEGEYVWALRDINLEVKQGEVLGIIGKNGAGKSTLLKLLSRVTGPTTGQIKVKGRIASLLEVGTGFHPELTGKENIFLNGAILGMTKPEIRSKFDEIVDFAGVAKYINTPVKRYSSGMYVRLAFAVAAHLEPDILVVDEVLAVGDAEFQKKAIGKMQDVSTKGGRTVLFVSHNMQSIRRLCSKIYLLRNGLSDFSGDVNDGIERYFEERDKRLPSEKNGIFSFGNSSQEGIWLNSVSLQPNKSNFNSGEEFTIELSIVSRLSKNIIIKVTVNDNFGNQLFILNNYILKGEEIILKEGSNVVNFIIDKLPLNKGTYFGNISIFNRKERILHYENAFKFSVIEGNFYKSKLLPEDKNGVLIDYSFKHT